jgi:hypothetical protein
MHPRSLVFTGSMHSVKAGDTGMHQRVRRSWLGRMVSVRNMVPTLTSRMRRGLSLNGRCQAIRDTGFILVPAEGGVRPAEACSRHCIAQHWGCL